MSKDIFYASLVCAHYQLLCFTACELVALRSNENLSPVTLLMTLQHFYGCIYRYNFSSRGYIEMERLGFVSVPSVMLLGRLNSYLCLVPVRGCHFVVLDLCSIRVYMPVSDWFQYCHSRLPGCYRENHALIARTALGDLSRMLSPLEVGDRVSYRSSVQSSVSAVWHLK